MNSHGNNLLSSDKMLVFEFCFITKLFVLSVYIDREITENNYLQC